MSFRGLLLVPCLLFAIVTAAAQDVAHAWNPRTGDAWTDTRLADINDYAGRYREAFVDELVRYFDAPRALVAELIVARRWAPGDVYYACAIARVAGRPCRAVLDAWAQGHDAGWAPIVEKTGISPGSPEARRLKQAFIDTYERWARPIELDAELDAEMAREASNRDKAKVGASRSAGKDKGD